MDAITHAEGFGDIDLGNICHPNGMIYDIGTAIIVNIGNGKGMHPGS